MELRGELHWRRESSLSIHHVEHILVEIRVAGELACLWIAGVIVECVYASAYVADVILQLSEVCECRASVP